MFFLLPASGSHILSGIHILQLPRIPCFIPVYLLRMGRQNCSSSLVSQKPLELRHIIYRKDGRTSVSSPAGNCSKTCFSCFPAIYQAGNGLFRQPGLIAYSKTDSIQASLLQFLFQRLQGKMNGMRNSKAAVSVSTVVKPCTLSRSEESPRTGLPEFFCGKLFWKVPLSPLKYGGT